MAVLRSIPLLALIWILYNVVAFLVEFITVERAGNSVFFILMVMALLDVIAGFSVTIFTARRDLTVGENVEL